ncbi:hypothetical protein QAD02_012081 [Eretmocerus hayati]|uniref:Uncharacterized protein n=1 Tax=Eretmocerus hayati TaxID=131215 RepID=A0ACC2P191_9HYME|nr:hypothetical protein QAD02_012081 [Eretmocerus hayati]
MDEFEAALRKIYRETIKWGTVGNVPSFKVKIENSYIDLCNPLNYKDLPLTDSPFGKGRERVIDKSVRESQEYKFIDEKVDFNITSLGQNIVTRKLGPNYYCKPYKFIIYQEGSFFEEHVDTVEKDLEYTLSLILLTNFKGGEFKFGKDITINGHKDYITYVLFRIQCPHSVEKVTEGIRIVLTFKVYVTQYTIIDSPDASFLDADWIPIPKLRRKNVLVSCPNIRDIINSLDKSGIKYKFVCAQSEYEDEVYSVLSEDDHAIQDEQLYFQDLIEDKASYSVSHSIIFGTTISKVVLGRNGWTGNSPCLAEYDIEYNKFILINPDHEYYPSETSSSDITLSSQEDSDEPNPELDENSMDV